MCHECEVVWGEPQPDCDDRDCGKSLEEVKNIRN